MAEIKKKTTDVTHKTNTRKGNMRETIKRRIKSSFDGSVSTCESKAGNKKETNTLSPSWRKGLHDEVVLCSSNNLSHCSDSAISQCTNDYDSEFSKTNNTELTDCHSLSLDTYHEKDFQKFLKTDENHGRFGWYCFQNDDDKSDAESAIIPLNSSEMSAGTTTSFERSCDGIDNEEHYLYSASTISSADDDTHLTDTTEDEGPILLETSQDNLTEKETNPDWSGGVYSIYAESAIIPLSSSEMSAGTTTSFERSCDGIESEEHYLYSASTISSADDDTDLTDTTEDESLILLETSQDILIKKETNPEHFRGEVSIYSQNPFSIEVTDDRKERTFPDSEVVDKSAPSTRATSTIEDEGLILLQAFQDNLIEKETTPESSGGEGSIDSQKPVLVEGGDERIERTFSESEVVDKPAPSKHATDTAKGEGPILLRTAQELPIEKETTPKMLGDEDPISSQKPFSIEVADERRERTFSENEVVDDPETPTLFIDECSNKTGGTFSSGVDESRRDGVDSYSGKPKLFSDEDFNNCLASLVSHRVAKEQGIAQGTIVVLEGEAGIELVLTEKYSYDDEELSVSRTTSESNKDTLGNDAWKHPFDNIMNEVLGDFDKLIGTAKDDAAKSNSSQVV